MYNSSEGSIQY